MDQLGGKLMVIHAEWNDIGQLFSGRNVLKHQTFSGR